MVTLQEKKKYKIYTTLELLFNIKFSKFRYKAMLFTNNISKSINHLLNSNFKYKYPIFSEWKKTILTVVDNYYSKDVHITKIMIYLYKFVLKNNKILNC